MTVKALHFKYRDGNSEYFVFVDVGATSEDYNTDGFELHCETELDVPDCYPTRQIILVDGG